MKRYKVGLYFLVIFISIILIFPFYWMLITSLLDRGSLLTYPPQLLPNLKEINLSAYFNALSEKPIIKWFFNSSYVALFSTICTLIISSLAAYSISRYSSKFNRLMGYSLLVIRMLPGTLLIVPFYIIFKKLGLINTHLSLIIVNVASITPFATWMMKGFFDGIPVSLEESAQIDGCTPFQAIWKITLPLTAPGLSAVAVYSIIISWSEFLFARTFLTGQDTWTITVGISSLIGEHVIIWNELMAGALISTIPVIIAFVMLEKYIVAGMTAGAVKQ